ncbi:hypothetical protein [Vibrio phage S4-7]|nr:hypothetical protein [Vibrio phage S4-7]
MVNYEIGAINGHLLIKEDKGDTFIVDCTKCNNNGLVLTREQIRTNRSCGICNKRIPLGKTYGMLFVKSLVKEDGPTKFVCECFCGNVVVKTLQTIKSGKLPSCGCIGGNTRDITGEKLNSLTAIENTFNKSSNKDYIWKFLCDCGNYTYHTIGSFRSGGVKSCGCARTESRKVLPNYHGMQDTPEYTSWRKMRERCLSPNCKDFPSYGGSGVEICPAWDNFLTFYEDMGDKPDSSYTLDRVNPDGGYSKDNCRWASPYTQARNQRSYKEVSSKFKGVHFREQDMKWVAKISIRGESCIIGTYQVEEDAAKAYNTATHLIFEGYSSATHLTDKSEYLQLNSSSRFMTYWLPRFKNLVREYYEKENKYGHIKI